MGKLIYVATTSLDGFVADASGNIDWTAPDEEVHAFMNDLLRPVGTYLFGRRMYETMVYWERPGPLEGQPSWLLDFSELWRDADKVVYSTTMQTVASTRTRLERVFDPDWIRQMKLGAARDISVGGSHLAGQAITAGIVDEIHLFLKPVLVVAGTRVLSGQRRLSLDLVDERRFPSGAVYLRYSVRA